MADAKDAQSKLAADRVVKLTKYLNDLKIRLSNGNRSRQAERNPAGVKNWLEREIARTTRQIEDLRIKA